jgi:hypothetical protein
MHFTYYDDTHDVAEREQIEIDIFVGI